MNKRVVIIGGIVIAAGLLGAGGWFFLKGKPKSGDEVAYVTTVGSLTGGEDVSGTQNRYAGVVEPQKTVEVKLDTGRAVQQLMVEEGQTVKAGDQLFSYDVSAGEEELATARLELERLKTEAVSYQEQINTYQQEKEKAAQEDQLSYTIQIQSTQMDLKKNEYEQKSKAAEIEKLEKVSDSPIVTSEIDGVIKTINSDVMGNGDSFSDPDSGSGSSGGKTTFITILGTGNYRVKGKINEQNMGSIVEGDPVIIRSRVDTQTTWKGTMGEVDTEHAVSSTENSAYGIIGSDDGEDQQTSSSSYPFYVNLDNTDGLMLGQHVYIEMDYGQEEQKKGVWLNEFYIVDAEEDAYVWASDGQDKLEKRSLTLGDYDQELGLYEVKKGLTKEDCIAFPADNLQEGMAVEISDQMQIPTEDLQDSGPDGAEEIFDDSGIYPGMDTENLDAEIPADTDEDAEAPEAEVEP